MNVHENARLTPVGRALMAKRIEQGLSVATAAATNLRSEAGELGRLVARFQTGQAAVQPSRRRAA